LEIKIVVFNLNSNSALGMMVLVVFSIILDGTLLGQMFAMLFNNFLKQNWVLPRMNSNVVYLIPKIQGVDSIKVRVLKSKYEFRMDYRSSSIWPGSKQFYSTVLYYTSWIVGTNSFINFWNDK